MILIGMAGFTVVLTIAGLIQGQAWINGETVYRVLPEIHPYYITRASLGLMIFSSAILGFFGFPTLGYYLAASFDNLHYREVWSFLYAMTGIVLVLEGWSHLLRRRFVA